MVGYGPLEGALRAQVGALGLGDRITWAGPLDQPAVRAHYRASDLFVLASEVAPDGDRDGLPNVVVEALSQGLPVVATRAAAIPELVLDGLHGRLVPPGDAEAFAAAIESLAQDPDARHRMGAEGIRRVAPAGISTPAPTVHRLLRGSPACGGRGRRGAPGTGRAA